MSDLAIELRSTLTCPACGAFAAETMPTDACQYFADCPACGAVFEAQGRRLLRLLLLCRRALPADPGGAGERRDRVLLRAGRPWLTTAKRARTPAPRIGRATGARWPACGVHQSVAGCQPRHCPTLNYAGAPWAAKVGKDLG